MTRAALATLASAATATAALPATASALSLGVTTKSPQDVAATTATLRAEATVSALGANVSWEYGTTTRYGATTRAVGTSLLGVSETLTLPVAGLTPNTTYHLRAIANGLLTTAYGRDVSFTTDKVKVPDEDDSGSGSGDTSGSGSGTSGSGTSGSGSTPSPATGAAPAGSGAGSGGSGSSGTAGDDHPSAADVAAAQVAAGADPAAAIPAGTATAAVTPVLGKTLAIAAVQGTITATSPSGAPVDLSNAQAVPTGTVIDARKGTVELTTALDADGATQTGRFWGSRFEVRQSPTARGLTRLVLRGGDFSACSAVGRAATSATKKKQPVRRLWGSDHGGRFETRGRGSVATVRGTAWMTRDTCRGTLTRVTEGAVAVRDLRRHQTVVIRRGHEYLARAAR
jgi:hypothetical protein